MTWQRTFEGLSARCESVKVGAITSELHEWLQDRAREFKLRWLLAHADDGVIWGELRADDALHTSASAVGVVSPELRLKTLQAARLFGPRDELLVWRADDDQLWARLIRDLDGRVLPPAPDATVFKESFVEDQILWGTQTTTVAATGFTVMSDGVQGLTHVAPLTVGSGPFDVGSRPLRLRVRHYIQEDKEDMPGMLRVAASRLCDLFVERTP